MVPLKEILTKADEWIDIKPDEVYREVTVRLWGKGVIQRREVAGAEIAATRRQVVRSQQFILSRIDARNGAFGLIPDHLDGAIVSNDFPVFNLNRSLIIRGFLNWMSKTGWFVDLCKKASEGTTNRVRLKEERFLEAEIPLPPLSEQRRIVARIEELATKIKEACLLRQQAIDGMVTILPSVLTQVFDVWLGNRKTERLASDKLAQVVAGQHIMAGDYNDEGNGFPYITGPADFGPKVPKIRRWTHKPKTTALPGDVLLTVKGAGVGKLNLAPSEEVAIGRQLMAIRPNSCQLNSEFLAFLLQHRLKHFQSIATATTVPGFKKTHVEDIAVPSISVEEQRHIVAYLGNLQAKVDALKRLQAEITTELDALLPSILDRAFKGEL